MSCSLEESCGSSSDDDSILWTEGFDEVLDSIYLMDDDSDGISLRALVGPSSLNPKPYGFS